MLINNKEYYPTLHGPLLFILYINEIENVSDIIKPSTLC